MSTSPLPALSSVLSHHADTSMVIAPDLLDAHSIYNHTALNHDETTSRHFEKNQNQLQHQHQFHHQHQHQYHKSHHHHPSSTLASRPSRIKPSWQDQQLSLSTTSYAATSASASASVSASTSSRRSPIPPWPDGPLEPFSKSEFEPQHFPSQYQELPYMCDRGHRNMLSTSNVDNSNSNANSQSQSKLRSIQNQNPNDQDSEKKSRKRPKTKRPSAASTTGTGPGESGLEEGQEAEFDDPSGDWRLGPVYIHPPKGTAQACVRCHRIKRKCDNARPRCSGCNKADVACVYEMSPATSSNLKKGNTDYSTQLHTAHHRIARLEETVRELGRGAGQVLNGLEQFGKVSSRSDPESSSVGGSEGDHINVVQPRLGLDFTSLARQVVSISANPTGTINQSSLTSLNQVPGNSYPPYQSAQQAAKAYFSYNEISYPFIDKTEFEQDMAELYESSDKGFPDDANGQGWSRKEFMVLMVITIGTLHLEGRDEVQRGSSKESRDKAFAKMDAALILEDMICIQSLLLLATLCTLDYCGISLWQVIGLATRVAQSLNLHRNVESPDPDQQETELRRRVFYSLFSFDRLVAATLSKPLAIADDDIDVELLGNVLTAIYSVSGTQHSLSEADKSTIISSLHARFDSWLADCPIQHSDNDYQDGFAGPATNYSWFLLSYHQGLCFLYRPSPLYPTMTPDRLDALHDASSHCVELYLEMMHGQQQLSYNIININMQFLVCISLLYCLCEYDNRIIQGIDRDDHHWPAQVANRVSQCTELLGAFSKAWPETRRYREIFTRLSDILLARHGTSSSSTSVSTSGSTTRDEVRRGGSRMVTRSSVGKLDAGISPQSSNRLVPVPYNRLDRVGKSSRSTRSINRGSRQGQGSGSMDGNSAASGKSDSTNLSINDQDNRNGLGIPIGNGKVEDAAWSAMTRLWHSMDPGPSVLGDGREEQHGIGGGVGAYHHYVDGDRQWFPSRIREDGREDEEVGVGGPSRSGEESGGRRKRRGCYDEKTVG